MKNIMIGLSAICFVCISSMATAEEGFYFGLRAANVSVDEEEFDDFDGTFDIKGAGKGSLIGGYDFGNSVSIEVEAGATTHDVEFSGGKEDLDMSTLGMYAVYRSEGQWFFKGRGGLLSRTYEYAPESGDSIKENGALISIGLGGGINLNEKVSLEAEYVTIEEGISSFGLNAIFRP